jgi:uncharacterized protein
MVIDAFVQVGKSIHGYELSAEELIKNMDQYGIDRSVTCPVQPYTYHLEPENDYIAELAEKNNRFIGFCRVDPRQREKAVIEVERSINDLQLKGVFLHPWEEGYRINADFVVPVLEKAQELKVPVMIASGYPWFSHALQVVDVAKRVPDVKIIMTHGATLNISGFAIADAFLALSEHENLFVEISGVYRQDYVADIIEKLGVHRVLFGSNSPNMHQGFELDRAKNYTRNNDEHQQQVLGGNLEKLLQLKSNSL